MKGYICLLLLMGLVNFSLSAKDVQVVSPDGKIKFVLSLKKDHLPAYSVRYDNRLLIENSELSLDFDNGLFGHKLQIKNQKTSWVKDEYDLIVGKNKHVKSICREAVISLVETEQPNRTVNLVVRVYNDGAAFRYEFPEQHGWYSYVMFNENSEFNISGNPKILSLYLPSYTSSHEGKYAYQEYDAVKREHLMDMPVLLEYPGQVYLAVTEAAVRNYAGMYLMKTGDKLVGKLSPYIGQDKIKVKAELPHHSPWRVLMIGNRVGVLIESDLLTNLNEPCAIDDVSWIKPGKSTFPWWNGTIVPDTTFAPGNNFETNKYYIDFCARNGIEYHSVVECGLHEWYTNDGYSFMPGPGVDVTKPVGGIDMKRICDYGKSKGVDVRVWVHWAALYPKIDEAFALFEEWGLTGMMVDFMDRDDQEMICIQEEILQKAAKHHLHIQFHGSSKPSGLHRTYPNEFTREGTLNYECYKWSKDICADHDISMPFSRVLAGAADYHLGGFRAVPDAKFKIQHTRPLVTSTRCHMLAMYVVLESYLGLVCDYPSAYEGQPGFEFITGIPTTWDETRVLQASVNEFIVIARRKGDCWYIGALNNSKSRSLSLPLNFLSEGMYEADIYTDADHVIDDPNLLVKETRALSKKDSIDWNLASDGGAVMRIRKL